MEPDIEDEFAEIQPVRTRPVSRQPIEEIDEFADDVPTPRRDARPAPIEDDFDEFADEPASSGSGHAAPQEGVDEFPDDPPSVDAEDEFPDAPSNDDHLLFPPGWDRKAKKTNEVQATDVFHDDVDSPPVPGIVTQALLRQYQQLNQDIDDLIIARWSVRDQIRSALAGGATIEPGRLSARVRVQNRRRKSYANIADVLGNDALNLLLEKLPTYRAEYLSVYVADASIEEGK